MTDKPKRQPLFRLVPTSKTAAALVRIESKVDALQADMSRVLAIGPQPVHLRRQGRKVAPTPAQWAKLDALAREGLSTDAIAARAGISAMTLARIVKERHGSGLHDWRTRAAHG